MVLEYPGMEVLYNENINVKVGNKKLKQLFKHRFLVNLFSRLQKQE